jgi:glycerol-3-phosphate acyltransferase PlsX
MEEIRLAIDVESGDFGPEVVIPGIIEARKIINRPFKALLCGNQDTIRKVFDTLGEVIGSDSYEIIHCRESVSFQDKRSSVWKRKKDSSIIRCITLQKDGRADASISAGDTAILLGASIFILGRSEGVLRPALAAFLPTVKKKPVLLLDVGANLGCRSEHLVSFAALGSGYVKRISDTQSPAIALLNIGKEPMKGTNAVVDAANVLQKKYKEYIGFIEGGGVVSGEADVVVCDGFVGNVLLKAYEQFHHLIESVIGSGNDVRSKLKGKLSSLDPELQGAVPFLGIKGTVLKAHGGSSAKAIAYALCTAISAVDRKAL